jgi:hypothetical protein
MNVTGADSERCAEIPSVAVNVTRSREVIMTTPLGQGSSTWARTTRFAELEWGMSRKKVLSMFASARSYPRYETHHPRTGELVIVRDSIALPSNPPPVPDLVVYGSVSFDDADRLDSITLKSPYPRPAEATDAVLLLAANKVITALGVEPLTSLSTEPRTWKRKATHVVFEYDDECFWFELSPTR